MKTSLNNNHFEKRVLEVDRKEFGKYLLLSELTKLPDPPNAIFALGNLEFLNHKSLTVIGARKPSEYGVQVISDLIPTLVSAGITIVSDLEQGCDLLAQESALSHNGSIIAVLSSSLSHLKSHKFLKLIEQALAESRGLFLSEYGENYPPTKWKFAQRNRLIAALGLKLLVIEAGGTSGTLHTTTIAKKLKHQIFAVPGNIYSNNSVGTNNLLKEGALPVTTSLDILGHYSKSVNKTSLKTLNPSVTQINLLKHMSNEIDTNTLARVSNIPIYKLLPLLTTMELAGLVKKLGDKWVRS